MSWWCDDVARPSQRARETALQRQAQLTKPPGSLGRLEALAVDLASWQDSERPAVDRVAIQVFAADHGVVEEGVSAFPQAVTGQMIANFAGGGAAISVMSRRLGATLSVVNLGTAIDPGDIPGVRQLLLAPGTANICEQPAMDNATLAAALEAGRAEVGGGLDLFIGGEMGIANTASAAALASYFLGRPARDTVGRGTGVDDTGLARKAPCSAAGAMMA